MARNKELCVILLDVGPDMNEHIELAARGLGDLVEGKIVGRPGDQMALVLFGTTGTSNGLATEMGGGQYEHVTTARPLEPPGVPFLQALLQAQPGRGRADFLDGLTVAADLLYKAKAERPELERATSRIILLSNFLARAEEADEEFMAPMTSEMAARGVRLDIVSLDVAAADEARARDKSANAEQIARLCAGVSNRQRSVTHPAELAGVWKPKETAPVAYYSGPLSIGATMNIKVKVCKKTAIEKLPTLGKVSPLEVEGQGPGAPVAPAKEFRRIGEDDDDEAKDFDMVNEEDVVKAYRFGREVVPVSAETDRFLKYAPAKAMELVGFAGRADVPRHQYMKDVWVAVADKDNAPAGSAMAALVAAMLRQDRLAIVRFVPRAGGAVSLCAGAPIPGTGAHPPHLLLNTLPYLEDCRQFLFGSFNKPERRPTEEQLGAALDLIDAMPLAAPLPSGSSAAPGPPGGARPAAEAEALLPEATANPALHRFLAFMNTRALDPDAAVPPANTDPLAQRILEPRLGDMPGAEAALSAAAAALPTGPAVKARRRWLRVGTETPVDDFHTMLEQGSVPDAIHGMRKAIGTLLDTNVGENNFAKAAECVEALRAGCATAGQASSFNDALRELCKSCRGDAFKGPFWAALSARGVGLLTEEEAPGAGVSAAAAEAWLEKNRRGGA